MVSGDGEVFDVAAHPHFSRAVDNLAELYDAQFDPATRDLLTFVDDDGMRRSTGWLVPRTIDDLERRREALRYSTVHTFGVFGRPPDYGSTICMGYLSLLDRFEQADPAFARRIASFVERAARENAICADVLAEPQSSRLIPNDKKPGRLRVVEERPDGVVLYGGKAVGSVALIGHYMTIANLVFSDMDPATNVWCQVPVNAENITLVSREPITTNGSADDHPLDVRGDEPDSFFIFDHVFVPWDDIFVYQRPELLGLYYPVCSLAHWHILARLWYRAELLAGLTQAIVDGLGTGSIPGVRTAAAEVFAYATSLKAFVLAAEAQAKPTATGVMVPDISMITAGRLLATERYPIITQIVRDLSGQGLISRFPNATWEIDRIADKLEEFTAGNGISGRDKNRLFNLAWDMTCSSHAMRVALFENLNATPPAWIKEQIYRSYQRTDAMRLVYEKCGVTPPP